jgi:hypothetical protein
LPYINFPIVIVILGVSGQEVTGHNTLHENNSHARWSTHGKRAVVSSYWLKVLDGLGIVFCYEIVV